MGLESRPHSLDVHPYRKVVILSQDQASTAVERRGNVVIVRAVLADMHAVADIVRSSADWYEPFVDEKDMGEHDVDEAWAERNFRLREFFVAKRNGRVIGTVSLQDAGDCAYLGYVYLHADEVGQGLGRRLLEFAERECRARDKRAMVLIAHPEAAWATRAYVKYGFECVAERKRDVLAWNEGWLEPFYEEGFALFRYDLTQHE